MEKVEGRSDDGLWVLHRHHATWPRAQCEDGTSPRQPGKPSHQRSEWYEDQRARRQAAQVSHQERQAAEFEHVGDRCQEGFEVDRNHM